MFSNDFKNHVQIITEKDCQSQKSEKNNSEDTFGDREGGVAGFDVGSQTLNAKDGAIFDVDKLKAIRQDVKFTNFKRFIKMLENTN